MALIDHILSDFRIPSPSGEGETNFRLNGKIKTIRYHEEGIRNADIRIYHFNQRKKVIKIERVNAENITRIFYNEMDEFIKEEFEINDGSKYLIKELIYSPDKLPYVIKKYDATNMYFPRTGTHDKSIRMTYNDLKQLIKQEVIEIEGTKNELQSVSNYEYDSNGNRIKSTVKYLNGGSIDVSRFEYDKFNREILYDLHGKYFYKRMYDERGLLIKKTTESTTAEGTLTVDWIVVYDYNLRGNVQHVQYTNLKKNIETIMEYQYTYDDMNNVIKSVFFREGKKGATKKFDISYYK